MRGKQSRPGVAKAMVRCYMQLACCCFKPKQKPSKEVCSICARRLINFIAYFKWMALVSIVAGHGKDDPLIPQLTMRDFQHLHCHDISISGPAITSTIVYQPPEVSVGHTFDVGILKKDFNEILEE